MQQDKTSCYIIRAEQVATTGKSRNPKKKWARNFQIAEAKLHASAANNNKTSAEEETEQAAPQQEETTEAAEETTEAGNQKGQSAVKLMQFIRPHAAAG